MIQPPPPDLPSPLLSLPPEVFDLIAKTLSLPALLRLSATSKSIRARTVDSATLWRHIEFWSLRPLGTVFHTTISSINDATVEKLFCHILGPNALNGVSEVTLNGTRITAKSVDRLLRHCRNIETLSIQYCYGVDLSALAVVFDTMVNEGKKLKLKRLLAYGAGNSRDCIPFDPYDSIHPIHQSLLTLKSPDQEHASTFDMSVCSQCTQHPCPPKTKACRCCGISDTRVCEFCEASNTCVSCGTRVCSRCNPGPGGDEALIVQASCGSCWADRFFVCRPCFTSFSCRFCSSWTCERCLFAWGIVSACDVCYKLVCRGCWRDVVLCDKCATQECVRCRAMVPCEFCKITQQVDLCDLMFGGDDRANEVWSRMRIEQFQRVRGIRKRDSGEAMCSSCKKCRCPNCLQYPATPPPEENMTRADV